MLLFEEFYFVALNIAVITVNKVSFIHKQIFLIIILTLQYVLSVLHFTIPTVFQGWQTLVCVLLLTTLMRWKKFRVDVLCLEKRIVLRMLFPLICFSLSNVAGSKALAELVSS